ncbi:metallophosphoesterase family protein [Maribellus maritimus]|uniref:metallophosphoesterase family protein n=1 Tax=Maribellus maritimus TaxID=2870838 RepID=UPI001EEAAACE|nr:metallophosphoesterase [Maribellus maritimus]MCG6186933.1 metallophosphoesterase [Maribellus maritimus]
MNDIENNFYKILLVLGLIILIRGGLFGQNDTLSFLHITDTHVIFDLDFFQPELAENRSGYKDGVKPLKNFVENMPRKTQSNFVIATGDLVDFFEGENSNGKMLEFQLEQLVQLMGKSQVPFYFTLGNHDIISYSWGEGERISTQNNAEKARAAWIKNASCFSEGTHYSKIFKVGETSFRFIFLDDGYYDFSDEENVLLPYVDTPQLHWLEGQINQSDDDVEIILMHIPLKSNVVETGGELFSVLAKYSSVKMILAGHNHKNDIQSFANKEGNEIIQVRTGAFAQDTTSWRQIKLTENNICISLPGSQQKEMQIDL